MQNIQSNCQISDLKKKSACSGQDTRTLYTILVPKVGLSHNKGTQCFGGERAASQLMKPVEYLSRAT